MGSQCCKGADPDSVGGKSMLFIPYFLRSRLLDSMNIAERLKGSPANTVEIYVVTVVHYRNSSPYGWVGAFLQNLYREDLYYADPQFTFWTTNITVEDTDEIQEGKQGYEKFSERFRRLYPGYCLDEKMRIRALPTTRTVNLRELVDTLRSKDEGLWEQNQWMFQGEKKYLDNTPYGWNKVAVISFPRSGNTFMRKYCELLTGTQTGADNTLHTEIIFQLQGHRGEDIVDDSVWVVKSHSPWCMPYAPEFFANKVVCVVRNPLDVIISWLTLVSLANHNEKTEFKFNEEYPEMWDWWVHDCVNQIRDWYRQVLHDARMRTVPTVFVRFEDMISDPSQNLNMLMQFIVGGISDMTGTNGEKRVNDVLEMGHGATKSYSLKDSTKQSNASAALYTEEQIEYVKRELKDMLYFFGYVQKSNENDEQKQEESVVNPTGFFKFDEHVDRQETLNYLGYEALNRSVVEWTATMNDSMISEFQYQMSDKTKEVDVLNFDSAQKAVRAVQDWSEKKLYDKSYTNCK